MFLRYFCHVAPFFVEDTTYGNLSFEYFRALKKTGTPMRVLPINMTDLGAPGSQWEPFVDEFSRAVPKQYLNIICGDNGELVRLYTVGTKNLAITATLKGAPDDDQIAALKQYDAVICPSEEDVQLFQDLGIDKTVHAAPEPTLLASLIRGLI
jgi:hypothetical protein